MSSIVPYVTCTGVQQVESAYYTLTNGVLASQVLLRILPQAGTIPSTVNVTFVGGLAAIPLRGCVPDFGSIRRNPHGQIVSLRLWDRRYWWQYAGEVNGRYNVHRADGSIDDTNKKSLRELAVMLLQLAGESNFNANVLPNDVYPEVEWDFKNPMLALGQLMEECGYEVCWNPISDFVHIEQDGVGADIPHTSDTTLSSLDLDVNAAPGQIAVACAPVLFQAKLQLESVMPELDGTVVPTESSSIKPASGWHYQQGTEFEDVAAEHGEAAAALARETYGRWFRVKAFADGSLNCPGYPSSPLPDILNIAPLNYLMAETYSPIGSTRKIQRPSYVQGVFLPGETDDGIGQVENTEAKERVDAPFDLDRHQMIVKFDTPVLKLDSNELVPADLWLTTSFEVTNATSLLKDRFGYRLSLGTGTGGTAIEEREDIQRRIIASYANDDPEQSPSVTDNLATVNAEALLQAQLAARRFQTRVGRVRLYRDIQSIVTDGAVKQVMWSQNLRAGADTMAGRFTHFDVGCLRPRDRARIIDTMIDPRDRRRNRVRRRRERDELR